MNIRVGLKRAALAMGAFLAWRAVAKRIPGRHGDALRGRVALITGGSRGLGLALARELGRAGCRVAICGRDRRTLVRAATDLQARGIEGIALRCDVSHPRQVARMVRRVRQRLGEIDLLLNNAGIVRVGPAETMTTQDFEEVMATNFWGTVHPTLQVLPGMRARGAGRIVNVTSVGGEVAVPHLLPYDCAKFAAVGFSRGLHAEVARDGISVTTVVPGLMRTGGAAHSRFKGDPQGEYVWFSLASATPLTSMSAVRAARRIVRAIQDREAEVTLSWQAKLLALGHDLAPGLAADFLGFVNRMLPKANGSRESAKGLELSPGVPGFLTAPMNRAALDLNQYEGTPEIEAPGAGGKKGYLSGIFRENVDGGVS